jgi:hypothetical protein
MKEHAFRTVEADGLDADADFSGAWFREREFVELEDFGAADLVEADDLYGFGHECSSFFCSLDVGAERKTQ